MNKTYAVIVAAGKGRRMGASINKQFLKLKDKPMLYYCLNTFSQSKLIDGIIIVCAEDEINYCKKEVVDKYNIGKVVNIVAGGEERQQSVYNGLKSIDSCDIVLIHDGARPFVSNKIIEDGINYAQTYGACACGLSFKDTIKIRGTEGFSMGTTDRNKLFSVQTPQCFKYQLIMECHEKLANDNICVTDDTTVVENYGNRVYLYEGSYYNIKVTTPEDLNTAEKIVDNI